LSPLICGTFHCSRAVPHRNKFVASRVLDVAVRHAAKPQIRAPADVGPLLARAPTATLAREFRGRDSLAGALAPPVVQEVLRASGQPLDAATRRAVEPVFGHDFSRVRVHAEGKAAESARSVDALAYTVGRHIVFGSGQHAPQTSAGLGLIKHELTHVLQQGFVDARAPVRIAPADGAAERQARDFGARPPGNGRAIGPGAMTQPSLQRYIAGEHAKFGATQAELGILASGMAFGYKVKKGEGLERIAGKFSLTIQELKDVNKAKLRKFHIKKEGGDAADVVEEGFLAGEIITIPPVLNQVTRDALKATELTFTLNGVTLDYGVGITMGDFFKDPADMASFPPAKLKALAALVEKEKKGTRVSDAEWEAATDKRYLALAEKNEPHFAPSNAKFAAVSARAHGGDHKSTWQSHHADALSKSQGGNKDEALQVNAFADHFLTDAFAAGHLVNKRDVMDRFGAALTVNDKGEPTGDTAAFFDAVAKESFIGDVAANFKQYETVKKHYGFHPNIDSVSMFSEVLKGIQTEEPEKMRSVIALVVHDTLNTAKGGIPVKNAKGDAWKLSGDGTLNPDSEKMAKKAVAQSQMNVLSTFNLTGPLDLSGLFKKVWDYVPFPVGAGQKTVKETIGKATDPKSDWLVKQLAAQIRANWKLLLDKLVELKKLRKDE
jgi:uncharacterized protein DUF4157/LysM domain-containing protein